MEKKCEACGHLFKKKPKDSARQWGDRAFCSLPCANKMKTTIPPHLYFWKYAAVTGSDDCWPWNGMKDQHGYGRVAYMTSIFKAHRIAFEMFHGPISDGMVIMHKCDNPNCVNPNHLQQGTQKQNMKDAANKGRLNPKSLVNLRPGKLGFHGAGPKQNGDTKNVG